MFSNSSILVKKNRSDIVNVLVDPFRMSGIISHINILQVYKENENKFTTLDKVEVFPKKFKVMYIFGTPDTKIMTFLGEMDGPLIIPNGIKYQGKSDDNTFHWTLEVFLRNRSEGILLDFHFNSIYKPKLSHKILGKEVKELKEEFDFASHVLNAHLVPYFKFLGFLEDSARDVQDNSDQGNNDSNNT